VTAHAAAQFTAGAGRVVSVVELVTVIATANRATA
jgi:hypothetical protein